MAYRRDISERFSPLFGKVGEGETDPMSAKWGWYQTIYALANGNYLDIDRVTQTKVEEALAYLTYERDLRIAQNVKIG